MKIHLKRCRFIYVDLSKLLVHLNVHQSVVESVITVRFDWMVPMFLYQRQHNSRTMMLEVLLSFRTVALAVIESALVAMDTTIPTKQNTN